MLPFVYTKQIDNFCERAKLLTVVGFLLGKLPKTLK